MPAALGVWYPSRSVALHTILTLGQSVMNYDPIRETGVNASAVLSYATSFIEGRVDPAETDAIIGHFLRCSGPGHLGSTKQRASERVTW
jgi:hypothetical protein